MTVTVRPVPQRVVRNGIRPFRPVRLPANNIRPTTVQTWRPPIPEPLPPAPLIGPRGLLALGALVLAQIWGQLASRPPTSLPGDNPLGLDLGGVLPADDNTAAGVFTYEVGSGTYINSQFPSCNPGPSSNFPGLAKVTLQNVVAAEIYTPADACGTDQIAMKVTYASGAVGVLNILNSWGIKTFTAPIITAFSGPNTKPFEIPSIPVPLPNPYDPPAPEIQPAPAPETQPVPAPVPLRPLAPPTTQPGGPRPLPGAPPVIVPATPGPSAPPTPAPGRAPSTVPAPIPGASPLPNGIVPPAPTPAVPATPPDAHFPVPGAPPVTGNGPRPTPEGIAQELGRLEQKVARLSNPQTDATGDATDRIGLALKLLGDLIEFFNSITAGGGYELSSPCEVDEAGQPIPVVVNFSGAPTALGVINNKIDAVAQLLQEHKNLKQPICRQTPAVGEPVTVQFVQVN